MCVKQAGRIGSLPRSRPSCLLSSSLPSASSSCFSVRAPYFPPSRRHLSHSLPRDRRKRASRAAQLNYVHFAQCRYFTHDIPTIVAALSNASNGYLTAAGDTDFGCQPGVVIPADNPDGLCPPPASLPPAGIAVLAALAVAALLPYVACGACGVCYCRYRARRRAAAGEKPGPAGVAGAAVLQGAVVMSDSEAAALEAPGAAAAGRSHSAGLEQGPGGAATAGGVHEPVGSSPLPAALYPDTSPPPPAAPIASSSQIPSHPPAVVAAAGAIRPSQARPTAGV